ncbi:hypothetical protein [Blastococcus xanthinilyticus]|uniref:Uncharacterized protein n=1 Tax=Blastococcus xanthinilyticus TaxID=1564164 RepID=A0A5S5D3T5_9ACTN|nr:hypothetical protein [Blastococcus xanthinilyticus]TYP90620.1 hypothetical protein BD833_101338 [Blastococcus xanthinilyticus]
MTLNASPPPARTDAPAAPAARPAADPFRSIRLGGLATAAGAAAWALGTVLTYDVDPAVGQYPVAYKVSSLLFQLGLVALVSVQLRTRATGAGRLARGFLHAEHVLLGLAIASSVQWIVAPELSDNAFFMALDLFWPLSMLGMAAIGIRIAIAGRWRGPARIWPAIAETWALVMFPAMTLVSEEATAFVSAGHLLIGYTLLGVILATRPELTAAGD